MRGSCCTRPCSPQPCTQEDPCEASPVMISLSSLSSWIYPVGLFRFAGEGTSPSGKREPQNDVSHDGPPKSRFHAKLHPREPEVSVEVNSYFLEHWPFKNDRAKKNFVAAGFPHVTCYYFPEALNDRIGFACRLLTLLFLVDDLLEDLSLEDGSAYNERLILMSRGEVLPDRNVPAEYITYDLWQEMRACDRDLADEILEPTFIFMRAQTDKCRLNIRELGKYLEYRERDVGQGLLSALMRFSMELRIKVDDLAFVKDVEMCCSKHISVVNDIYSFEKELKASRTGHEEGSALCSSVSVLANETMLDFEASKRVLWAMCREWELVHEKLVQEKEKENALLSSQNNLRAFLKGLEYQMSGNEAWSASSPRYQSV